jgi:hypothetical protein
MFLWLVGNYLAPQAKRPPPALVDPSRLANTSPGDVTPSISLSPVVDGDGFRAIVPSAIGDNGGSGGRDGTFTISLERPSQVGIIRVGSKVGTSIAKGFIGPSFAGIHNGTIRSARDKNRNCVAFLVNSGSIVCLGTSIGKLIENAEVRRA